MNETIYSLFLAGAWQHNMRVGIRHNGRTAGASIDIVKLRKVLHGVD
nr:hypothetical protein [Ktedonobacter robiniae]